MVRKKSKKSILSSRPPLARMMHLHERLSRNTYPNCQKEAADLEVSYKTIQRDIDFMRDQLGLPIDYDRNRYGFYYTEKVTQFPTVQVTEGELLALFVAQKALSQYQGTVFEEPLRNAFTKLTDSLKDRVDFQLGEMDANFSFRTVGTPISNLKLMDDLGHSVLKSLEISFEYRKLDARSYEPRRAHPYHLACVDNQWYLFAFDLDRSNIRTFALPRIRNLVVTDTKFKRPADFSPTKLLAHSFGVFSGKANHPVKIRFDSFAAQLIREKQWHPSQKIKELSDGGVELSMTLGSLHEVERWILSWREHAQAISPPVLQKAISKSIREMAKFYP